LVTTEADMDIPTGTLDKFHLGVSADGRTCMMVFVDEDQRTIRCVAGFSEFNAFIANLNRAAAEMSRRRQEESDEDSAEGPVCGTLNVAFAEFQPSPTDAYIEGALVGDAGQIVGIRMAPEVACQLTKAMLMAAAPASSC
jgi:hypothetical protein